MMTATLYMRELPCETFYSRHEVAQTFMSISAQEVKARVDLKWGISRFRHAREYCRAARGACQYAKVPSHLILYLVCLINPITACIIKKPRQCRLFSSTGYILSTFQWPVSLHPSLFSGLTYR